MVYWIWVFFAFLFDNFMRAMRRLHYSYLHERWTVVVILVVSNGWMKGKLCDSWLYSIILWMVFFFAFDYFLEHVKI